MNGLPELVQLPVHLNLGMLDRLLRAIDGIREQVAALADTLRVSPVLEFDPFEFKKITQGFEQFVFLYCFHSSMRCKRRQNDAAYCGGSKLQHRK